MAANLLGTIAFAWILGRFKVAPEAAKGPLLEIAEVATAGNFGTMLVKAIFAGWLVALLVWLLPFAETGRVLVIILMTYLIALGSFGHVIAGSVEAFYLVVLGERTWGQYLGFMAPALLGNIPGGVALVAALNHAQVTAGGSNSR